MAEKKVIKIKLTTAVIISLIILILIGFIVIRSIYNHNKIKNSKLKYIGKVYVTETKKEKSDDIKVVASLDDEITTNSVWCGTLQLIWNDMINNVAKQNIKFSSGSNLESAQKIADNLNKQVFKKEELSEKDYYKVYDLKTQNLKKQIEKAIKEKFNETSDVLNGSDWSNAPKDNSGYEGKQEKEYVLYAMLIKVFNFKNDFDDLENGNFGKKYKDIKYFGIDSDSESKLYSQVEVLYYYEKNDFAIILNTKEKEQVILARGANGNTFASIYNSIVKKSIDYKGNKEFTENDYLKVPNIKLKTKETFKDLCNHKFIAKDGTEYDILNIIQTIQLDMDKSGGRLKSEAISEFRTIGGISIATEEERYFYLNDEFSMFLKEEDKNVPYFAANIENITLFQ